jgi:4-amino-4-deoxy-L-arabinose transferase-like glycosyltransferase
MRGLNFTLNQKVGFVFILAAILLFVRLGSAPIYILDEAKNAQCAREMWYNANPVVPTFNGELRTDKPALHYWFMGVAYQVAGVGPAQARFFSAIMGLFTLFVTFYFVRKYAGTKIAFYTLVALVLSPHFLFEFRLSVPDPYLIAFSTAGLWFGFEYLNEKKKLSVLLSGAMLGVAVLAKGPVALVLPGAIFFIFMVISKKWHPLKDPFVLVAILLATAIAFPWYWMVHQQTAGAFTRGFFIEHNLERFSAEKEGHGGPFFITPIIVIVGMLPFSLLAIESLLRRNKLWGSPLFLFSAIVAGMYVVFFSISSTKLPNYPMPCYPFVAVMAGFLLNRIIEEQKSLPAYIKWIWVTLAIIIPIAAFIALRAEKELMHLAWVSILLLCLPVGLAVVFKRSRQAGGGFFFPLALSWVSFSIVFLWMGYPKIYQENPVTKLLPELNEAPAILAYKLYNPAFNFNLERPKDKIPVFDNTDSLNIWISAHPVSRAQTYIVISRLEYAAELEAAGFAKTAEKRDLFEIPVTVLWKKIEE